MPDEKIMQKFLTHLP